ncbi:hypothetical protein SPRG_15964, partial [Saprolegnia parasitica CBS 223.65]
LSDDGADWHNNDSIFDDFGSRGHAGSYDDAAKDATRSNVSSPDDVSAGDNGTDDVGANTGADISNAYDTSTDDSRTLFFSYRAIEGQFVAVACALQVA